MNVSAVMNTALSGMRAQTRRFADVATNVANATTPGYTRVDSARPGVETGQPMDITAEMTDMIEAKQAYQANAVMFETGADFWELLRSVKRD
ncbi:flagellar basal body rod C-terminal domain-containing protein [Rhizobium sp. S152]|uniref:flagellar basal body rod C-terminal domain-containing protein n=1 Tax=Rhizobium sp. S152 TaxID=3055038 RepID=UPI0025A96471|nr:flagellar basal body rod C-terminal domain-containing protein [Rhizobium sp. S152]MDM9628184.1 flagellar basal body rod C-terminal domain-containing protein [Rhizobium sp. S152]